MTALDARLAASHTIVVCGAGGVGKTTIAAAMGVALAEQGKKVLVLTVDPARRLGSALGLDALGDEPQRVDDVAGGEMWAAMVDHVVSWDRIIATNAPDEETRDKILANSLYQTVTGRFVHSHEYLVVERLHELRAAGAYDVIVIDTPPSRHAIDVLDAPARMSEFFGSRLLRWLVVPAGSRVMTAASRPFLSLANRLLGTHFLTEVADFFALMRTMQDGFVERADEVAATLAAPDTVYVAVTSAEYGPIREARLLLQSLRDRDFHVVGVVANRILPSLFLNETAAVAAGAIRSDPAEAAAAVDGSNDDVPRVLVEVATSYENMAKLAAAERTRIASLEPVIVEASADPPSSIADLHDIGRVVLGS